MNKQIFAALEVPSSAPSRRDILGAGAAGLLLAFAWTPVGPRAARAAAPAVLAPNAFVRVAPDNTVTVIIKHLEMGQGVYTGLSAIVAEELDADWSQVRAEHAPADAKLYANLAFGTIQGTGGSTAVANSWEQLRKAGATARAMLVSAAAQMWKVPAGEISVKNGVVSHAASKRSATFGALAQRAATLPPPDDVPLKDPNDFTLIGRDLPRLDNESKTTGTAIFALDVVQPGMVYAAVARPPRFGGVAKSIDDKVAKAVKGVVAVAPISSGVAVIADSFWTAMKARDALQIEWDESKAEKRSTPQLFAEYRKLAEKPGESARHEGDVGAALKGAAKTVTADFEFPYLAHAPMEPLDAVARITADGVEVWAGCQFHTIDQANAARVAGVSPDKVKITTVLAGGSFGRRANIGSDYIVEAVEIAKALPQGTPVKLIWTREDDIKGGRYRPMYFHTLRAGLDAEGELVAWQHRIVGQSLTKGTPFGGPGIDPTSVEGASNLPYAVPNLDVELHTTEVGVPVLWWRSVGSTHTAYSTEVFFDMVARAAGKDPLDARRTLLKDHPRHRAVLDLVAEKAGWSTALPEGKARGIAVAESFGSYVAQVAEVSRTASGGIKIERIVCAVDCGLAVTPDVIRAQMEGGIGYGLSAIMKGEVTLNDGLVEQGNFNSYDVLRINEMPKVEVHIVPSAAKPTGVGEPGVPPVGPAVANAIFALTGKAPTKLPLTASGVSA
jgi:isoquinoline 1-oxidoreductase beta subunit